MFVFAIITVGLEGSYIVRYVTRFAEDVFSLLVTVIFVTECFWFLYEVFVT